MFWAILILGVALWWAAHLFKRAAPGLRTPLGERGKGLVALALLLAVVLMVVGYRGTEYVPVWNPPGFLLHANNLLVLLGFYCFAASGMKTRLTRVVRHPQLTGFALWAVAHLIAPGNGDAASIILFGGLLAWALVAGAVLNAATPRPLLSPKAPLGKEIGAVVGAVLVTGVVGMIHGWLGPWPFGGA